MTNTGLVSDRILGIVGVGIGIVYTAMARTFEGTAFGSGPVGPKTLPTGVGLLFIALSAYLAMRPDSSPSWPPARIGGQVALVVGASYLYGQVIEPVGFIFASAAMIVIIGMLFRAPLAKLLPLSVVFPLALAFLFNNLLEIQLPAGWWGGF